MLLKFIPWCQIRVNGGFVSLRELVNMSDMDIRCYKPVRHGH